MNMGLRGWQYKKTSNIIIKRSKRGRMHFIHKSSCVNTHVGDEEPS